MEARHFLKLGKKVHTHALCIGLGHETMVHSAVISMYSRSGNLQEASKVFDGINNTDIVSWTAMINGYAEHGNSQEAISLFENISGVGLMPDYVTFIGVLTACNHAGLVDLGFHYFKLMTNEHQIAPSKEHYGCMIDLLCRAGRLSEAERMIRNMPFLCNDVVCGLPYSEHVGITGMLTEEDGQQNKCFTWIQILLELTSLWLTYMLPVEDGRK